MKKIHLADGLPTAIEKNIQKKGTQELLLRIVEACEKSNLSYVEINKALYLADKEFYEKRINEVVSLPVIEIFSNLEKESEELNMLGNMKVQQIVNESDGEQKEKTVQAQCRELKLEILKEAKEAMCSAVKTGNSAMVTAIAEILKAF